ncbi:MAG TPA: hypothetical protein PKL73_19110 [Polyangiaceae bacterium]|nr:MAG: hypothetical protein BWY17_04084 [Deltaproteobacteria bacterium ADurb.Bin207]HNS99075.1 hypothetical protein [Polyangiaceae bacterium]HNZ21690.1 hypothetical protein [Polyangiaceae bacterium]HOD21644.1 hypothetical protein [Polyangiaceae bacterium]HOE49529.1 hypothetical protein [Polyangiaceae bacterium]
MTPTVPDDSPRLRHQAWFRMALVTFVAGALLLVHARSWMPFFADDGFISLRYAQRLLDGHGLTWNDGERVEGYSNLLWVLGCAGLGSLGIDLVNASRGLGLTSALGALAALSLSFSGHRHRLLAPLVACVILALSGTLAIWSVGGLEAPMVACFLSWGLYSVRRLLSTPQAQIKKISYIFTSLPFALLCVTRPDGAWIALGMALGIAIFAHGNEPHDGSRKRWVHAAGWLLILPLGFVALQLLFRLSYYGAWLPNPAHAKLAFSYERWVSGSRSLLDAAGPSKALLLLLGAALLPLVKDRQVRERILPFTPVFFGWLLYLVAIGGDIFPARRHLVVPLILSAHAIAETISWYRNRSERHRHWAAIVCVGATILFGIDQAKDPENLRASQERWEWDGQVIGTFFHRHFGPSGAMLASDSAGALPYFSKLPTIDMLGINDRYLATHRPSDFGKGPLGHELGDGHYVWQRQPDLVVFGLPYGQRKALYRSGLEMQDLSGFERDYGLLTFEATGQTTVTSHVWVRRDSERLGVKRSADRVWIPGMYLAMAQAVAREDGEGNLGTVVSLRSPGAARITLDSGTWRATLVSTGQPVEIGLKPKGQGAMIGTPPLNVSLSGAATHTIDVAVRPLGAGMAHIRSMEFVRTARGPGD